MLNITPGHGDVNEDSHQTLPTLRKNKNDLMNIELKPFIKSIENDVDLIMTAHLGIPLIENGRNIPSSLSKILINDILKNDLNFKGAVITDAIMMEGISHFDDENEICLKALNAGNDILLMPNNPIAVYEYLCESLNKGKIKTDRINDAYSRLENLRDKIDNLDNSINNNEIEKLNDEDIECNIIDITKQSLKIKGKIPLDMFERNDIKSYVISDSFNYHKISYFIDKTNKWKHSFFYGSSDIEILKKTIF